MTPGGHFTQGVVAFHLSKKADQTEMLHVLLISISTEMTADNIDIIN